jgi:TonB family protein
VVAAPGRAVVGVDPDPNAAAPARGTQRGGSFSAGPDGGAGTPGNVSGQGGEGDSATLAGVRIPHLSVSPASRSNTTSGGLSDGNSPNRGGLDPDRETLLRQFRDLNYSPAPAVGVAAPERSPDPEFPFPGRAVYTLAVNMPNISSYSGSWIIEFAEVKENQDTPGELLPPSPRVKVDPVYSRAAIDERVEGDVVLHAVIRSDGLVDHIKVIKKLDARLDEGARTALAKWRFQPATKRGVPVDVETVVRIPFRLPQKDERR